MSFKTATANNDSEAQLQVADVSVSMFFSRQVFCLIQDELLEEVNSSEIKYH